MKGRPGGRDGGVQSLNYVRKKKSDQNNIESDKNYIQRTNLLCCMRSINAPNLMTIMIDETCTMHKLVRYMKNILRRYSPFLIMYRLYKFLQLSFLFS